MATLVLSTVGTALGGPVGGAIGSLIGQSIDQQIFVLPKRKGRGSAISRSRRLHTATQIPRIYGTMRIAGSVVWATDLVESSETSGAKGQPDVTYSYSVSMAVALSSRPACGKFGESGRTAICCAARRGISRSSTEFAFLRWERGPGGRPPDRIDRRHGDDACISRSCACSVRESGARGLREQDSFSDFRSRCGRRRTRRSQRHARRCERAAASTVADTRIGRRLCGDGKSIRAAIQPLVDYVRHRAGGSRRAFCNRQTATVVADKRRTNSGASADESGAARVQRDQEPARELPASVLAHLL